MSRIRPHDPFAVLGLDRSAALADDEVRAAWRRIAAATHPDRADGGDPHAFAAAAAAYTTLRTVTGRGEALADHAGPGPHPPAGRPRLPFSRLRALRLLAARIGLGRPAVLAARIGAAAGLSAAAVAAAGWQPATLAIITGCLTWLVLTGRGDLAPPPP
jgi:curved DNA-binding protein CbpA